MTVFRNLVFYLKYCWVFSWLIESILRNHEKIQSRITEDVATQKLKEEKEKESRKERIQKLKALQNGVEEIATNTQISSGSSNGKSQFPSLQEVKVTCCKIDL